MIYIYNLYWQLTWITVYYTYGNYWLLNNNDNLVHL